MSIAYLPFDVPDHYGNILFCLQLKMTFKVRVPAILASYSVFMGLSCVYMLLNFCLFFPC